MEIKVHDKWKIASIVTINSMVYWVTTPCNLLCGYRLFSGTYCLCISELVIKTSIFWDIMPCSQWQLKLSVERTWSLQLQGWRISPERNTIAYYLRHADFLLGLFYDREDGGDMFLRNIDWISKDFSSLYTRRQTPSCCIYVEGTLNLHRRVKLNSAKNSFLELCELEQSATFNCSCDTTDRSIWFSNFEEEDREPGSAVAAWFAQKPTLRPYFWRKLFCPPFDRCHSSR
jgi:hypothetical protein